MQVVSRSEWGARSPKAGVTTVSWSKRKAFMVHHSGGPALQTVRAIQDHCMDARGFLDIDYNWLVGQDGTLYEGRGWTKAGSHCTNYNTPAIGVCVIGNNQLSGAAKATLRALYAEACRLSGKRLTAMVHSDRVATECPGVKIREWMRGNGIAPRDLVLRSPFMQGADVKLVQRMIGVGDDGVFGPKTSAALKKWQAAHKLTADGIVGPKTRAAMGL